MPKTNVNDQAIYYEIHGKPQATPLVLIAGLGCDHTMWIPVLDALAKTQQVIIFDNRGAGQSSVPTAPYTITDMAHDVRALLESLNIHSANIIGSSMGGMIAQEYAINFPGHVNKLVLYSSLARLKTRTERLLLITNRFFELEYFEDALNTIMTNCYGDRFLANEKLVQQTLDRMRNYPYRQSLEGFWGQFNALRANDTSSRLHKITAPTLIISGERDILSLRDDAEELSAIANSVIVPIPDVAHLANIENPPLFLQVLEEFL